MPHDATTSWCGYQLLDKINILKETLAPKNNKI